MNYSYHIKKSILKTIDLNAMSSAVFRAIEENSTRIANDPEIQRNRIESACKLNREEFPFPLILLGINAAMYILLAHFLGGLISPMTATIAACVTSIILWRTCRFSA